jgi:hypothetical protein
MSAHFGWMTLDREQLPNLVQREPELLSLLDELQIGYLLLLIKPITTVGSLWPR